MKEWLYDYYKENQYFKEYVDKMCKNRNIGVFEALALNIVEKVAQDWQERAKGKEK